MARQQGGAAPEPPHEAGTSQPTGAAPATGSSGPIEITAANETPEPIDLTPIDGEQEPVDITPAERRPRRSERPGSWLDSALRADDAPEEDGDGPTVSLAPRRSSHARRIALGAALLVGLSGATVLGVAGVRIAQQKDAMLRPPDAVANLRLDDSDSAVETAENLRTALAAGIDLDETVAVVYSDPAGGNHNVFFFGGTALLFSPERELDEVLTLLGDPGSDAAGMRRFAAGSLGGVMKCGTVTVPEGEMSACGWADHGSVAVAMFPERNVEQSAVLMRQLRGATQTRS